MINSKVGSNQRNLHTTHAAILIEATAQKVQAAQVVLTQIFTRALLRTDMATTNTTITIIIIFIITNMSFTTINMDQADPSTKIMERVIQDL